MTFGGSCCVDIYLLVIYILTRGSQTSHFGESGPEVGGLLECRHSPLSHGNGLQVATAEQVIFHRARAHFQECLDSISICVGILYSSP